MKNKGLGKGLAALIGEQNIENNIEEGAGPASVIKIIHIKPNKFQPRKNFNDETIKELADSILMHGIIQPIIVRKMAHEDYQIVAGERRWRAAQIAGLDEIPVILKDIDDKVQAQQAIIENIQREDLNPLEEARAYHELMNNYNYSQEELSKSIGKNRSHIANMLRLVSLPNKVHAYILNNDISFSHAKVISGHEFVSEIADEIVKKKLSVRQTEDLAKSWAPKQKAKEAPPKAAKDKNASGDLDSIAQSLTETLGIKVEIEGKGSSGKIMIQYSNFVQLDNIIELLSTKH